MSKYAIRADMLKPLRAENNTAYFWRTFEGTTIADVTTFVNLFLKSLPLYNDDGRSFTPHIISVDWGSYVTLGTVPEPSVERSVLFTFADAKKNKYLRYGNELMDATNGFVVPYDGTLSIATFSQADVAAGDLQLTVNGADVQTLPVTAEQHSWPLSTPVSAGDLVAARNTGATMKESTLSIILDYVVPGPPPPPPIPPQQIFVASVLAYGYGIDPQALP